MKFKFKTAFYDVDLTGADVFIDQSDRSWCTDLQTLIRPIKPLTNYSVNVVSTISNIGYWRDEAGRFISPACTIR